MDEPNQIIEGVQEIAPEEFDDMFELETLSPPGESNGLLCVVIICRSINVET